MFADDQDYLHLPHIACPSNKRKRFETHVKPPARQTMFRYLCTKLSNTMKINKIIRPQCLTYRYSCLVKYMY